MKGLMDIDKLLVKYHGRLVGTMMMSPDSESAVFQYSDEWLANGFSISPIELPLNSKLYIAPQPWKCMKPQGRSRRDPRCQASCRNR